jgi:hypothetical protein
MYIKPINLFAGKPKITLFGTSRWSIPATNAGDDD